jgi:two-component system sensor histidine kinase KdpD
MADTRSRAEDFLELVERARRGRLKIYIGFAAGVGKTYRMLEEAHGLRKRGVDVVIGFIETHGRAETAALLEGLEAVPCRKVEYRGVVVQELDVDAVVARNPAVVLVDEIAHSNPPGSKNRRRYQDVLDILNAGINVIGAFNVQHLESLKDVVERTTGVVIRETVPDAFLQQADQVVNLDLAVEDLLDRLRSGRIYDQAKIDQALANFFRDENLQALRELSLREVAESVDRASAQARRGDAAGRSGVVDGKVMVCLASYSPRARLLLRRGSRMAGRLNTDWYAVYVETPREAPTQIDAEAQRHLHDSIDLARELGAEFIRLKAADPVAALVEFARSHGVGHLIVGRSSAPWWREVLRRSVVDRLIRAAQGIDVHVVSYEAEESR